MVWMCPPSPDPLPEGEGFVDSSRPLVPIVSLADIQVHFTVNRRTLRAVENVSLDIAEGRDAGPGGRERQRQEHAGQRGGRVAGADRGHHAVPRQADRPGGAQGNHKAIQIVFQDPFGALDPRMPVSAIIAEPLRIGGIGTPAERQARAAELVGQVGLPLDALNRYPHEFSGGQRQRIAIARALAPTPTLIVADEPLSALDVSIQSQVLNLFRALQQAAVQRGAGLAYLFISHDLGGGEPSGRPGGGALPRPPGGGGPARRFVRHAVPPLHPGAAAGRAPDRQAPQPRRGDPRARCPARSIRRPAACSIRAAPRCRRSAGPRRRSWKPPRGGRRSLRHATSRNERVMAP